ncbi:MAG TPA: hypothetical protein VED01_11265 [Burkholderiales bacterium]|nr:hypothetical protein [Burkholderiales bacterium]
MHHRTRTSPCRARRNAAAAGARERGYGGLVALMLIATVATTTALFAYSRTDTVHVENERVTREALAAAKLALIGYAVQGRGPTERPGELPCPDADGDGMAESSCTTNASLLGRLPWKTLGVPQLVDGAGEPLWYALSSHFRPVSGPPSPTQRINSDTRGTITVRAADGSTALTDNAVAVLFAPGAALGSQNRSGGTTLLHFVSCTLSGITNLLSRQQCVTNYLDAALNTNNSASATGPFIAAATSDTFNDKLLYLETAELIPLVEQRVGTEIKNLLTEYRLKSNCQCYPWADTWPYSGGIADVSQNRGRFPTEPVPENWGSGSIPSLPAWLGDNNWHNLVWYSVSRRASADPGGCRTCSANATLTVGDLKVAAVFFMPGTPPDGQARVPPISYSSGLTSAQRARADNLNLYLDDAQNTDSDNANCPDTGEIGGDAGWGLRTGAATCDQYAAPTSARRDRDRIHVLGPAYPGTCEKNGKLLASAAPCGTAWTVTNPTCIAAMPTLDACGCAAAARILARPPCNNVLNPGQCQTAIAQLNACTP